MKTASDAKSFIESMNARQRALRPSMLKHVGKLYVFSLYWHPFTVNLGHMGSYVIPAFNKDDPRQAKRGYSDPLALPEALAEEYDMQSGKMGLTIWDAMKDDEDHTQPGYINDVLGVGSSQGGKHAFTTDRTWFGVFVACGLGATAEESARAEKAGEWNFPTRVELAKAKARLTEMMMTLYQDAKKKALRGPKGIEEIQEVEREACMYLGFSEEWCKPPVPQGECPECHQPVAPGLPVHFIQQGGCGAVLDEEKVKKNRTPGYEHIWMPKPAQPAAAKTTQT
jgi:hypothetical protein